MKEIQQKQRFDLIAVLAILGIVLMFGFESIFFFELYRIDPERLPAVIQPLFRSWGIANGAAKLSSEQPPVKQAPERVLEKQPEEIPAKTPPVKVDETPVEVEAPVEKAPAEIPEELLEDVPVG